jgi:hypothetical protein
MYSFFLQNKASYIWIAQNWQDCEDEAITKGTFKAILRYLTDMKAAPKSMDAMHQFILHNPKQVAEFERSELLEEEILGLKEYEPEASWDDAILFEGLLKKARTNWTLWAFKYAQQVSLGAVHLKEKGMEDETGPTASIQWLRGTLAKDFRPEAPTVAGMLHENIPTVLAGLDEKLNPAETTGKFPLGFSHIDSKVVVGKQNLRYIGIVGMSGDGKTTLTNAIVYNWLKQGAHILYCSTEHTPQEIWEFMCFLHQDHPDYPFTLPGLTEWEQRNVSPTDRYHMNKILADIMHRKNLPGLLDCQQFRDWEEIKDYLQTNHKRNKYDILVVDYLGRLDVPGDQKFRDKAVGAMIHDGQKLTRTFDENRGIILLSPIQVNREGHKAAMKAEEGEARYNLNAISQNSEYQNDLDLCLSVWSDDDMKMENKVEIQVIKRRKGKQPGIERMTLNPNSGAFEYVVPPETKQMWERTVEDVMPEAITLEINSEEWGI